MEEKNFNSLNAVVVNKYQIPKDVQNKYYNTLKPEKKSTEKQMQITRQIGVGGKEANCEQFLSFDDGSIYNSFIQLQKNCHIEKQGTQNNITTSKKVTLEGIDSLIIVEDEPLQTKCIKAIFQGNTNIENIFTIDPAKYPNINEIKKNIDNYSEGKKPLLFLDNDYGEEVKYHGIDLFLSYHESMPCVLTSAQKIDYVLSEYEKAMYINTIEKHDIKFIQKPITAKHIHEEIPAIINQYHSPRGGKPCCAVEVKATCYAGSKDNCLIF